MTDIRGDEHDNQLPPVGQSNAGDDRIWGLEGDDYINGGAGNDELFGGAGADEMFGGAGVDTLSYWDNRSIGVAIDLTALTASGGEANGDIIHGDIENVIGTDYSDRLTGSAADNFLNGGNGWGNDVLYGLGGDDVLWGSLGHDKLYGGAGNDTLKGYQGNNQLYGGDGNDVLEADDGIDILDGGAGNDILRANTNSTTPDADQLRGGAGADEMDGGAGSDTASYSEGTIGVTVNLTTGVGSGGNAQGDKLSNIENIIGTSAADRLTGNTDANTLTGGNGNDTLSGMDGADTLDGGAGTDTLTGDFGNDILRGGAGADRLDGGLSIDTVAYSESSVGVSINLATGKGSGGNAQGDVYVGVENANGSTGADTITGNSGANALRGMAGADTLTGGGGADRFVFGSTGESVGTARDIIADFSHVQGDRIDLALIDASTKVAGDQAFKFIGAQGFHGVAGELRATVSGGYTYVDGDVNGDKIIDLHIALANHPGLVSGDFVL
ncbi:MAG: M10 family metallopeptidase C-terminal domain-containing protein [Inquilinus limosus]|uniref:M10 family metallopeptidase C-terminal domain-containing protein n=1 Tax=Inquilinus limosus TaxID=171674 RepID=A0A952FK18_9PROT|nr:M10 family metallopeptidase C-terminal domain-containing protein [Inquilinus limosus]